ncbi:hypothetical protein EVAR_78870_1 [Eumeta japonica]|uniref:Uncharacterized protein n=1 Tax=Eumeta variegata TaxID=151549 RepID=A0A4C1U295_EUMVA|nr:hypothetical protein EVAR_78870_1 [Eumeta japonica]
MHFRAADEHASHQGVDGHRRPWTLACNLRGVTRALPFSWVAIRYVIERELTKRGVKLGFRESGITRSTSENAEKLSPRYTFDANKNPKYRV